MNGFDPHQFFSVPKTKAVRLMRHLALAAKKTAIKENKKQELREHLLKIQDLSGKKVHREKVRKELALLDHKISAMVDRENKFFNVHGKDDKIISELRNKINNLSVQLHSFKQLQGKIVKSEAVEEKAEKMEVSEIKTIEKQIKTLEKFYNKIRKSKKHPKEHLKLIENRLKSSKEKLSRLKKNKK
jgi:hypothetical protein